MSLQWHSMAKTQNKKERLSYRHSGPHRQGAMPLHQSCRELGLAVSSSLPQYTSQNNHEQPFMP
jgi:hypothetical protein